MVIRLVRRLINYIDFSRTKSFEWQICRLCYHRIVKTETGTCPACRAEYKEENIQKKTIPDKKKKEGEVDPGWETGVGKKKANKEKKPAVPTYSGSISEL